MSFDDGAGRGEVRVICKAAFWVYVIGSVLALALIPATGVGLFGIGPNPFAALYAVVLGLPWSFLSMRVTSGDLGVAANMVLIALGMTLNAVLIRLVCRRWR